MPGDFCGIGFAHRSREVVKQRSLAIGIVRQIGLDQLIEEHDLGVGEKNTDFGPAQGLAGDIAFRNGGGIRQGLDLAVSGAPLPSR